MFLKLLIQVIGHMKYTLIIILIKFHCVPHLVHNEIKMNFYSFYRHILQPGTWTWYMVHGVACISRHLFMNSYIADHIEWPAIINRNNEPYMDSITRPRIKSQNFRIVRGILQSISEKLWFFFKLSRKKKSQNHSI